MHLCLLSLAAIDIVVLHGNRKPGQCRRRVSSNKKNGSRNRASIFALHAASAAI
ncbi:hypothetical protein CFter6_0648 [Collimonas fungivorans]|uniref:Uncharacterized protein n=1 Tax=Collimonas fungivorans TaxID=158899 RepID=A0A127P6H8_9BURK|nr:hypothetical protein CFter6_0648 [Collimonas fungivorans]